MNKIKKKKKKAVRKVKSAKHAKSRGTYSKKRKQSTKKRVKIENKYVPKPYKILDYHRESPDTFTITIDMAVNHDPGQFVQVSLPGIGECPISICSDSSKFMKLNIREVGNMTRSLAKLKKGDTIMVRGPYGHGYPMKELNGNNLLIIGGGCGVAPLKGIIDYVENHRKDYRDVHLFLGYRSPDDIIFKRELEEWKTKYNLKVTVDKKTSDTSCYNYNIKEGFITVALKEADISTENKIVFLCGPPVMIKFVIEIIKEKGFHDDQIFVSEERLMYCGIGVCCHCMIRDKYTCVDGPVFRYDEIKDYKND